jgi:hypothetical protein
MKRLFLALLFAIGVVPWLSCKAGDGAATAVGEKKNSTTNVAEQRKKAQAKHQYHVAQMENRGGVCRDSYCRHAAGSPWWPGAPGD